MRVEAFIRSCPLREAEGTKPDIPPIAGLPKCWLWGKCKDKKGKNMEKEKYNKKFSIAHWDSCKDDNIFLKTFEGSSEQWKKERYDIYFGTKFIHQDVTYGETMGEQATPGQYRNLLKIQEKYGIPISLTLNEMVRPIEMIRKDVVKDFVSFIKKYYDDGVRSCTISHTHLMRIGALQEAFPDMDWKNTVNHRITTTQEFVDYVNLGYTTLQLDRNYNRNLKELKRTKEEADRLGVKTCLLIMENCMPECPFKVEHDCWQGGKELKSMGQNYWEVAGNLTCNGWRSLQRIGGTQKEVDMGVTNPRTGTDIMVHSKDDWDEFAELVDVFKLSGRLNSPPLQIIATMSKKFEYFFEMWKDPNDQAKHMREENIKSNMCGVSSFKEIYENNLAPFFMWFGLNVNTVRKEDTIITDIDEIKKTISNHIWNSKEGKSLCKTLKNCQNQCYRCHQCDDLFETGKIDSILSWRNNPKNTKKLFNVGGRVI